MNSQDYVTLKEATQDERIPYAAAHLRHLCHYQIIPSLKVNVGHQRQQWLIHLPTLLDYSQIMSQLGPQKHNPALVGHVLKRWRVTRTKALL